MEAGSQPRIYIPASVLVFIGLATGITLSHSNHGGLTILILAGLSILLIWRTDTRVQAAIVLFFTLTGLMYYNWTAVKPVEHLPTLNMAITGKVCSLPAHDGDSTVFYLRTEQDNPYLTRLRVKTYFRASLKPGDMVQVRGIMKPPLPPSNPGEFDYPSYLARRQVHYLMSVKTESEFARLKEQQGWQKWVASCREKGQEVFAQVLPAQEAAILNGMLLGQIEEIDPDRNLDFQKTGIFHVFSVSGLHVGFLLLLNGWIMSLLKTKARTRFVSGIILLLFYGFLTGWPVSLQRAAIMGGMGLLAYYSGRHNSMLNALALAGVVILALNPAALLDISFQLSFGATFGLVYIFPLLRERLKTSRVADIILLPLCAEIMIIPLIAYYFNLFSPVSLVANILSAYVTGGIVIAGFIGFLMAQFSLLAAIFLYLAGALIELLLLLVDFLKNIPGAYHWSGPGLGTAMAYYLVLVICLGALVKGKRRIVQGGIAVIGLIIASFYLPAGLDSYGQMEVVFLDVGQGDSILLKTPRGKFILVDGGGSSFYDVGSLKVMPYLHRRGINELYMIINTHPDIDHLQGLETVAAHTRVRHIAVPASLMDAPEYARLKDRSRHKLVPLTAGQTIAFADGSHIRVLLPDHTRYMVDSYNNQSIVLETQYGGFKLLLTGDIDEEALNHLITHAKYTPVTVVKVPHHGSKNSAVEALYDSLQPKYAVISAGRNNSFGHPHAVVLDMLDRKGIDVLRTDRDGAIIMKTDGHKLKVECTLKR